MERSSLAGIHPSVTPNSAFNALVYTVSVWYDSTLATIYPCNDHFATAVTPFVYKRRAMATFTTVGTLSICSSLAAPPEHLADKVALSVNAGLKHS